MEHCSTFPKGKKEREREREREMEEIWFQVAPCTITELKTPSRTRTARAFSTLEASLHRRRLSTLLPVAESFLLFSKSMDHWKMVLVIRPGGKERQGMFGKWKRGNRKCDS